MADHRPAGLLVFHEKPLRQLRWRGGFFLRAAAHRLGVPAGEPQTALSSRGGQVRVGGEDKDAMTKVQLPLSAVVRPVGGTAALVQNGHEDLQHLWVGFFQLVEHENRVGTAAHRLKDGLVLVAHIPRRRADEPVDGVGLGESVQLRPDELVVFAAAALQGGSQGLAQLGLPHPGGAVEDQREGPGRGLLAHMGIEAESGGLHGVLLSQDGLAKLLRQAAV